MSDSKNIKNKTVIILRGLPGAGKSYLRSQIADISPSYDVISADSYWLRPDGKYSFNFKELGAAHDWAHKNFLYSISKENEDPPLVVLVDNTNITLKDCKFYIDAAISAGWNIVLWESGTEWAFNPQICFEKNTHGVPLETIKNMQAKWISSEEIAGKYPGTEIDIIRGFND